MTRCGFLATTEVQQGHPGMQSLGVEFHFLNDETLCGVLPQSGPDDGAVRQNGYGAGCPAADRRLTKVVGDRCSGFRSRHALRHDPPSAMPAKKWSNCSPGRLDHSKRTMAALHKDGRCGISISASAIMPISAAFGVTRLPLLDIQRRLGAGADCPMRCAIAPARALRRYPRLSASVLNRRLASRRSREEN